MLIFASLLRQQYGEKHDNVQNINHAYELKNDSPIRLSNGNTPEKSPLTMPPPATRRSPRHRENACIPGKNKTIK